MHTRVLFCNAEPPRVHVSVVSQTRDSRSSVGVLRPASEPCEEKGSAAQGGGGVGGRTMAMHSIAMTILSRILEKEV